MVYSYHDIVVDREVARRLRSNDTVNMLVSAERRTIDPTGTALRREKQSHLCLGYTGAGERLFSAEIGLVPLSALNELRRANFDVADKSARRCDKPQALLQSR